MKVRKIFIISLVLSFWVAAFGPSYLRNVIAQQTFYPPTVFSSGTFVSWTGGTLNNGGHAVTITASTASITANRTSCTATTGYNQCNIVFANSAGTVSVSAASNALTVATAAGNIPMAFVEVNGGGTITNVAYPQQAGQTQAIMNTECLASLTCAAPVNGSSVIIAAGSATLTGGTATVTGIVPAFSAFNPTTLAPSYSCVAFFNATTSGAGQNVSCVPVSGSSLTITVGNSASSTDKMRWIAISNSQ